MLRITGYRDRCSVAPGDEITFFVHIEFNENCRADIGRLINGDTKPEGSGVKEQVIRTGVNKTYRGKHQPLMAGSYIMVPDEPRLDVESLSLCAYIYPTTPVTDTEGVAVGEQAIVAKGAVARQSG